MGKGRERRKRRQAKAEKRRQQELALQQLPSQVLPNGSDDGSRGEPAGIPDRH